MSVPEDEAFQKRIEHSLETVRGWESDEDLLRKCREKIPWEALRRGLVSHKDPTISREHAFLKLLAKHFQTNVMTWINKPPCSICSSTEHMENRTTRTAETEQEKEGQASRVEVYECTACTKETTFPRYNSTKMLLETCSGRCGEYANLFGLYCRAAGFETRYVLDWTDHVWTEVKLEYTDRWIMVDSCEGVTDEFSMYEAGWGKKLSYILAIHPTHVVDVTPKYTRLFRTGDFQARRRAITSSEAAGESVIRSINQKLQKSLPEKESKSVKLSLEKEEAFLSIERSQNQWGRQYESGRISGSREWRSLRQETGTPSQNTEEPNEESSPAQYSFRQAAFYPFQEETRIQLQPYAGRGSITVNGTSCAVGIPETVSVVVLDEKVTGCVLQSHCFASLSDLEFFVTTLPKGRIVLMAGKLAKTTESDNDQTQLASFPGLKIGSMTNHFAFAGQNGYTPKWATFIEETENSNCLILESSSSVNKNACGIRTCRTTLASSVIGRLPERSMPLQTQKLASYEQKRKTFETFIKTNNDCFGYTTKPGAPVYLLGESAYPFSKDTCNDTDNSWNTFLVLPKIFVPDHDVGIQDMKRNSSPMYEVPLESEFFVRSLGPTLLRDSSSLETASALRNARLVGLYFSAHWCGPCRSFTPMLSELYSVLKESHPTHGLEIVFVSSDRDQNEFQNYFATMPWLALPLFSYQKEILSSVYGVKGIPSLVILDALSGQVVVPATETRQEVQRACNFGDSGITTMLDNWLDRVPPESKELIKMLESSCEPEPEKEEQTIPEDYLMGAEYKKKQTTMRSLVKQLVEEGMDEEEALEAAQAIQDVSEEEPKQDVHLDPGPLDQLFTVMESKQPEQGTRATALAQEIAQAEGRDKVHGLLATTLKYLANCAKSPWTTKFRRIQLSFRLADLRITSVQGGIRLLEEVGFLVEAKADDYTAIVPVYADVSSMMETLQSLSKEYAPVAALVS